MSSKPVESRIEECEVVEVYLPEQNLVISGHDAEAMDPEVARRMYSVCSGDRAVQRRKLQVWEITTVPEYRYGYDGIARETSRLVNEVDRGVSGTYRFTKRGGEWVWVPVE